MTGLQSEDQYEEMESDFEAKNSCHAVYKHG